MNKFNSANPSATENKFIEPKPALLTRAEIDYLSGKSQPNPNLAKVMRHNILSKIQTFLGLELPLLQKACSTWSNLQATLNLSVNTGINLVNAHINRNMVVGNNMRDVVARGGFEPPICGCLSKSNL